jgi:hypothetical protein
MIKGTYIFYEDGKEIYRADNIITKFGKRFLASYIAGNATFNSKNIALGIASGTDYPLSASNSRLGFEFYSVPVSFGSIDIQPDGNGGYTYGVIYKTTLPQDVSGIIKEIGLYPGGTTSQNTYDSKFITDFDDNMSWIDSQGYNPEYKTTPTPRIGDNLLEWKFIEGSTVSTREFVSNILPINLNGYSPNDTVTVAFNRADSNSSKIRLKFYFTETQYFYHDISSLSGTGDRPIVEVQLSDILSTYSASPTSYNINKLGIEITRSNTALPAVIYFDGVRINDEDTFDANYGLISRALIDSPYLTKVNGRRVDIEYKLSLGF